jgi:peroxiredoxin
MSLESELAAQRERAYARRSPQERADRANAITEVQESGLAQGALQIGDRIPAFELPNTNGQTVKIGDLLANGPVVISFYRGSWCPYCQLEIRALRRRYSEIRSLGATLLAVSPERPERSRPFAETEALEVPVLWDSGNAVAQAFRLVHRIDAKIVAYQLGNGNDVAAFNGAKIPEVPLPATYVVDGNGVIRLAFVDADYTRRVEPDRILESLRQMQSGEIHRQKHEAFP